MSANSDRAVSIAEGNLGGPAVRRARHIVSASSRRYAHMENYTASTVRLSPGSLNIHMLSSSLASASGMMHIMLNMFMIAMLMPSCLWCNCGQREQPVVATWALPVLVHAWAGSTELQAWRKIRQI